MPRAKKPADEEKPAKAPKKAAAKKAAAPRAPKADAPAPAREAPPKEAKPKEAAPKGERHRLVFPLSLYEPNKDAIKAVLKEHGLAWQYLGPGKGRYHKEGVNLFAQFSDAGADYSLGGADQATVNAILAAWERLLGPAEMEAARERGRGARKEEKAVQESEEMRLWRLGEPQPRPGEPEFFLRKRREEWLAKKPGG